MNFNKMHISIYTGGNMGYNLCYKSVLTQKESHVEDEPGFKVRVKRKNQHKAKMVLSVALHHRAFLLRCL